MYIEYFLAVVPIFMFDMTCQYVQQSGGKSKDSNKRRAKKKETLKGQGIIATYIKKVLEMNRYEQIPEG